MRIISERSALRQQADKSRCIRLRTNAQFASYGASRAAVRMLAQSLAREFTDQGIHVVHTIANGGIDDKASASDLEGGKKMAAYALPCRA